MFEELLLRRQGRAGVPADDQLTSGEDCLILRLGDDSDEVFANDYLFEAWNVLDRLFVDMGYGCAHLWRPHNATVKHTGYTDRLKKLKLSRHQGSPVERGKRFAENCPLCGGSPLCCRVERDVELLASDEPLIRDNSDR